jgi:hypothetical protein
MEVRIVFFVALAIVVYLVLFSSSNGSSSLVTLLVIGLVVWLLVRYATFFVGADFSETVHGLFSGSPTVDIRVDKAEPSVVPEIKPFKQVFTVPDARFTYNDSKAICAAYGARQATYGDLVKAHKAGASWCSSGWIDGQNMAFPMQKEDVDRLKDSDDPYRCGFPGVNVRHVDNPATLFGATCFGYKPRITSEEADMMGQMQTVPVTAKEAAMNQRVEYWKTKLPDILVAPFNSDNWSRY